MKQFLKVYHVILHTQGPVFIGSGEQINKKEYVFLRDEKKIVIPDMMKMYQYLKDRRISDQYEQFLLKDQRLTLGDWFREHMVTKNDIQSWTSYQLDCGEAIWEKGRQMEIRSCIKDAYGCPYIPGSSLKGMLRTVLLAYDIKTHPEHYTRVKQEILQKLDLRENRNRYLNWETKKLEEIAFHTLKRTEKPSDMVNDMLSGMIVSDSQPLSVEDLTLCQKVEYHKDGNETRLPLLRESIKPGTDIHFTISIDESICPFKKDTIEKAIQSFAQEYYRVFSQKFPKTDKPQDNIVYLGGGAGYVSKTVVYSLFDEQAVRIVSKIYQNTGVPREHGHSKDVSLGVSPHILKKTRYQGRDYQFGECLIEVESAT